MCLQLCMCCFLHRHCTVLAPRLGCGCDVHSRQISTLSSPPPPPSLSPYTHTHTHTTSIQTIHTKLNIPNLTLAETSARKCDIAVLLATAREEHGAHEELDLRVALGSDGGHGPLPELLHAARLVVGKPRGVLGHVETQGFALFEGLRRARV